MKTIDDVLAYLKDQALAFETLAENPIYQDAAVTLTKNANHLRHHIKVIEDRREDQ